MEYIVVGPPSVPDQLQHLSVIIHSTVQAMQLSPPQQTVHRDSSATSSAAACGQTYFHCSWCVGGLTGSQETGDFSWSWSSDSGHCGVVETLEINIFSSVHGGCAMYKQDQRSKPWPTWSLFLYLLIFWYFFKIFFLIFVDLCCILVQIVVDPFGPVWTYLDPYEAIWTHVELFGAIRSYKELFRAIWSHMEPYEAI